MKNKKNRKNNLDYLEKKYSNLLIALMGFACIYYFLEPKTIGHDKRYITYIFWLPTIIGMLALGIYRRKFLLNRFNKNKGIALRGLTILLYLIQGLFFSYFSFGQIAKLSWDYTNYSTSKKNKGEKLECKIVDIYTQKRFNYIRFIFNGRKEKINVSYKFAEKYKDIDLKNYVVELYARKGIWNYYLVDAWDIQQTATNKIYK